MDDFAALISPAASGFLAQLSSRSRQLTLQRFGKVVRLFAPLYVSNECINNCAYCGFSRDNPILRVTLSVEEVLREARALREQGFRNILLVAGEHPNRQPTARGGRCAPTRPRRPTLMAQKGYVILVPFGTDPFSDPTLV